MMKYLVSQFGHPRGWFGRLVGKIMAYENLERNTWAVMHLNVQPRDRVLEIGFGPGVAIELIAGLAVEGFVAGVEVSEIMVRQARKRNALAVQRGQVELLHGTVAALPFEKEAFEKVVAINSLHHWPDPEENLKEARRVLQPHGLIAIVEQPHCAAKNAAEVMRSTGARLAALLEAAGFSGLRLECKSLQRGACVCALGFK